MKYWKIALHSPWISFGILALLILLGLNYYFANEHTDGFWKWIDPVAGIMTFVTSLAIYIVQAKHNWEQSLEKQLSVDYIYTGGESEVTIVKVINAYLASDSDVRAWAQSLGQQIMGLMDFDMNWEEKEEGIFYDNIEKKYVKRYAVQMYLYSNPLESEKGREKIIDFLGKKFKHSAISGSMTDLPIKWVRN